MDFSDNDGSVDQLKPNVERILLVAIEKTVENTGLRSVLVFFSGE